MEFANAIQLKGFTYPQTGQHVLLVNRSYLIAYIAQIQLHQLHVTFANQNLTLMELAVSYVILNVEHAVYHQLIV